MSPMVRGLAVTQSLVGSPTEWHLLLLLAQGPQHWRCLRYQMPETKWRRCWQGLWRLWRHHLIMFHVKHGWTLTTAGETLRPILIAIQTCNQERRKSE